MSTFQEILEKSEKLLASKKSQKPKSDLDQFLNWKHLDTKTQYELITDEIERHWHFPTLVINNLLKHKSRLETELKLNQASALTLLQSQALSFRHQSITQYQSRLDKDEEDEVAQANLDILNFQDSIRDNEHLKQMIQSLPTDWRIVQLTVDDEFSDSRFKNTPKDQAIDKNFALKLISIECGDKTEDYITCHEIPSLPNEDKMPTILKELQDILAKHTRMYKKDSDKSGYKNIRDEVDNGLESLLDTVENKWLGFYKVLLLGKFLSPLSKVKEASKSSKIE